MRRPSDLARERRIRRPGRGRRVLVVLGVVAFLVLTSLRGIAGFYTDYLWFDSLGFTGVFTGVLGAKVALGVLFSLVFFGLLWSNLFIADRLAPRFRPGGPEEEVIERYQEMIGHRTGLVRVAVAAMFAVIAGAGVASQWNDWILFTNAQTVGIEDPQFDTDIGFYLFRLPFLSFVVDWLFAGFVIILVVTAVAHYLNGGIRAQGAAQRVTSAVKGHLSVLLGVLALVRAVTYYLQRFELSFSERGAVDGATYTDVNAQLPALRLLIAISLAAFALFIINIFRRGWVLPVVGVGLWAFTAVVVGGIYPAVIQRLRVEPAELARERPYIDNNLEATRRAMNLSEVATADFPATDELDADALADNAGTIDNIRLWDPDALVDNFAATQGLRQFYRITDVDVDRYVIDGDPTQLMISTRELNADGLPQSSWEARTLAYTHGYGVVAAPASTKDANGQPELLLQDIPVQTPDDLPLEQPAIYIGEDLGGYVITGTEREEIDFQDAAGATQFRPYEGEDGVSIGGYGTRLAFALRFGDINALISGNLRSDSKIIFQRDVRERVETLAPFLAFDADPYPVIVSGELKWVIDAYTTSDNYPNAEDGDNRDLPAESGLRGRSFNYVRNSVKAVVDAYDGTVDFYLVDESDPLAQAYRSAFPALFSSTDEISPELQAHFRYPEDLFRVQTGMWGRYHVGSADDFYNGNDAWNVSQDPNEVAAPNAPPPGAAATAATPAQPRLIDPYYQLLRLPGEEEEEFVLVRPLVNASGNNSGRQLTALMVARSDPEQYGQLRTYVMDRGNLPDGPTLVAGTIQSDAAVAQEQTFLDQAGSDLMYGDLLTIPIGESLLYVRPVYVEATSNRIPELERVVVAYEGQVSIAPTLDEALDQLFDDDDAGAEDDPSDPPPDRPGGGDDDPDPPLAGTVEELLTQAEQSFADADEALEAGDLAGYQEANDDARRLIAEALARSSTATTTTTSAPPSA